MLFNIESHEGVINKSVKTYILSVEEGGSRHESKFSFDINSNNIFNDVAKWISQHVNMLIQLNEISQTKTTMLMDKIFYENHKNDDDDYSDD